MAGVADPGTAADDILMLERNALDRWGHGDPAGFLEVYGDEVTYFDPATATRLDGHHAMKDYYRPWVGKIHIDRYDMLNPQVIVEGDMALLTYNLVNYVTDDRGVESELNRWNATAVYRRSGRGWASIHSHWSFTRHPALQATTLEPEARPNA